MKTSLVFVLAGALMIAASPAFAFSKAAQWLINQEIKEACDGRGGIIDPAYAIERDMTGDGKTDFVLSHEGIECSGEFMRSGFCGAQVCSVKFYVRRGELLEFVTETLGGGFEMGGGNPPQIKLYSHGGGPYTMQWNGKNFD